MTVVDIVFFAHKDYHVQTIVLLLPSLHKKNITFAMVDMSEVLQDQGAVSAAKSSNINLLPYRSLLVGSCKAKMIVCFNDWDPFIRPIVKAARSLGIPTVGIVEGIQDYKDSDTGKHRNAYTTVEYLLLPGKYDSRYFVETDNDVFVTGLPRIEKLLQENVCAPPQNPLVIINVNFSYDVLSECRDQWVWQVVNACKDCNYDYVISQHKWDEGDLSAYNCSSINIYDLLKSGSLLISRFSSVILESLALSRPVIYYNPHDEKVDKFKDSMGAYDVVTDVHNLPSAIKSTLENKDVYLSHAADFLHMHCNTLADGSAIELTAKSLIDILQVAQLNKTNGECKRLNDMYFLRGAFSFVRRFILFGISLVIRGAKKMPAWARKMFPRSLKDWVIKKITTHIFGYIYYRANK